MCTSVDLLRHAKKFVVVLLSNYVVDDDVTKGILLLKAVLRPVVTSNYKPYDGSLQNNFLERQVERARLRS